MSVEYNKLHVVFAYDDPLSTRGTKCSCRREKSPGIPSVSFLVSVDFKNSPQVVIFANKCRHVTSLKTALFPKCTTVAFYCGLLRRGKATGERFTVVKYESKAVDIFILLHIMVNRCQKPEIHYFAKSQLNSSVRY